MRNRAPLQTEGRDESGEGYTASSSRGWPERPPGDGCPQVEELASFAAGLTEAARGEQLLAHAGQCDACGAILRRLVEDFSERADRCRIRSLMNLQNASESWQQPDRPQNGPGVGSRPGCNDAGPTWLTRAAAVIVAAGAGWLAWDHWIATDPARLIAESYAQQRPFEFRIPDAGRSDVRLERGANGSSFQRPPALLEAEAKIARELAKDPDNVKWLSLRARAEMLSWDPATAIATLQRALDRKPGDPDLNSDLGMAYALRAEADQRDVDYAFAIEYLGRSLKTRPNSPATVFNRAIVFERMHLNDEASQEWRRYLEMDPAGAWHDDAQRRLSQLESKKNSGR